MTNGRRAMIRTWSALMMSVVGIIGGLTGLFSGGRVFVTVCLIIVGLCGVGLLVTAYREHEL